MRTRFAPSPTGYLHLGHAYSALTAFELAQASKGTCLLRIEDIDTPRCKPEFEKAIYEDLHWLGLSWPEPVMRQSERMDAYSRALNALSELGVTYPCSCNRGDIKKALTAAQEGDVPGADGIRYPGTCRTRGADLNKPLAIRLHLEKALRNLPDPITYSETFSGTKKAVSTSHATLINQVGDIVLARKDIGTSYHLSVVVDDAAQSINTVVRGEDMADQTPIHRILQQLLMLPEPQYFHHELVRDEDGKRLAKRDDARAIRKYREDGLSTNEVNALLRL